MREGTRRADGETMVSQGRIEMVLQDPLHAWIVLAFCRLARACWCPAGRFRRRLAHYTGAVRIRRNERPCAGHEPRAGHVDDALIKVRKRFPAK
jgi:hypothetical protein